RHHVDVPRMAVVQHVTVAAGQSLADAREAGQDHDRPIDLDRQLIERVPQRIAGRHFRHLAIDAESDEAGIGGKRAVELTDRLQRALWLELQPVAENRVGVLPLQRKCVVVVLADLLDRQELGEGQVEDHPGVVLAEIGDHLLFGEEGHLGLPNRLLLGELFLGAEDIAAPGAPMGMAVEDPHQAAPLLRRSMSRLILEVCDSPVMGSSAPPFTTCTLSLTPSASFSRRASSAASPAASTLPSRASAITVISSRPPGVPSSTQTYSPLQRGSAEITAPIASGNTLTPR